ncbi:endonuclease/exonuclease/phosphatase family protein [Subsaxibacter sp. CAU 1640]|uniref:endonuclease/exonuclease/phosphatase family protein n=1 Tax=Subsaxibacter sp. CAU 1640 TaxID=2933271 RepID=UPI002002D4B3|nr:endonuclease/exonuclease/phosphatase family protein [Subsaxibacter sp. CAU 1640]MCK7590088.1 endonuclease/exonuclease/phosphatase family protein [Subsaxibacter sp. CAU 1640]
MRLKSFLIGFGVIAILLTLLPLIPSDYWWIRMFDFPHLQLTTLTFLAILVYYIKFDIKQYKDYLFMFALIFCFLYQFGKIMPYTPAYAKEMYESSNNDKANDLKLFTANVLQDNEEHQKLAKQIADRDADILILTETDQVWLDAIKKELSSDYQYQVEVPLPNTYGMLLYSKLPLINPSVHYLVDDSIPSIHTKFKMKNGKLAQLYAIHPTPPMPQENPKSTDRDAEMMIIAKMAKESKLPVIVAGDFNDVAWSPTSLLFQRVSGLLDVRVGRGFYCTFNAKKMLLRWPLDQVYVSPEFRLRTMESCESIDSDHFPFYVELSHEPEKAKEQLLDPTTKDEWEQANKQIQKLKRTQRSDS